MIYVLNIEWSQKEKKKKKERERERERERKKEWRLGLSQILYKNITNWCVSIFFNRHDRISTYNVCSSPNTKQSDIVPFYSL